MTDAADAVAACKALLANPDDWNVFVSDGGSLYATPAGGRTNAELAQPGLHATVYGDTPEELAGKIHAQDALAAEHAAKRGNP